MMLHEEPKYQSGSTEMEQKPLIGFGRIKREVDENGGSLSGYEPNGGGESTTDRSSASPSNADEINDLMMDDDVNHLNEKDENGEDIIDHQITGIDTKFLYIQHQMSRIMRHLEIKPCSCQTCSVIHESIDGVRQLNEPTQMLAQLFPNASSAQLNTLLDLSKMNNLPSQVTQQTQNDQSKELKDQQNQNMKSVSGLGSGYSTSPGGGKMASNQSSLENRKSATDVITKSQTPTAIAKKYGFTPPVSTYYQRKDSNNTLMTAPLTTNGISSHQSTNSATASPGPSSDGGDRDEMIIETSNQHNNEQSVVTSSAAHTSTTTPMTAPAMASAAAAAAAASPMFAQSMVDILKMNANAAHSTGSPGFLRGRGRGRPKLIGDELDADLVDYMVQVKQTDPHSHMTASQALLIAKQYILERAPGLLEEHGGHVKLKLTWAMKLVTRIGERQKEIEYGLPAGSLSNMGKNLNTLPGGNFMADVMAQNIISQHMMMVNQMTNGSTEQQQQQQSKNNIKKELKIDNHHNEENVRSVIASSGVPEIVNVKELNIPFLNSFLAELNEKNRGSIDGEIGI